MESETIPEDLKKAIHAMEQGIPGPNPIRQAAARQAFLAEARRLRQQQAVSGQSARRHTGWKTLLWPKKENSLMATLAKAMVIMVVATGLVTGTALAADDSLPGEPLYPADLALEQAQLALTVGSHAQAQLRLKLVEERADELLALAEAGKTPDEASQYRLQEQLNLTLETLAQVQEQQRTQLMTQFRDQVDAEAAEFEALNMAETAGLLVQTREMAQLGIDDPAGFENRMRSGMGWPEDDEPVDEEPVEGPDVVDEEDDGETVEDETLDDAGEAPLQTRDQLQDQSCGEDCDQTRDQLHDQTQDQMQDQMHDQTQDQTQDQMHDQTQDQTRDQLQDGSCDTMDCTPMGDGPQENPQGENHQDDHHGDDHSGGGDGGGSSGGSGGGKR
jgi:uncharacterized membrane protein YgcG